jgi:hypothetical protein
MTHKPIDAVARLREALPPEFSAQYNTIETLRTKFIRTERETVLAQEMNLLINNAVQCRDPNLPPSLENRAEGRGLALIGPTGVGKTNLPERLLQESPGVRWLPRSRIFVAPIVGHRAESVHPHSARKAHSHQIGLSARA